MPGRRHHNPRLAKSYRCYSVADIVELYGVHPNTVRNWLADGLEPIDDRHETLVNGRALNAFHAERRLAARQPCDPDQLYCFGCHQPRTPAAGLIDVIRDYGSKILVEAICPVCASMMRQSVSPDRLSAILASHASEGEDP